MDTDLEQCSLTYERYLRETALGQHDLALEQLERAIACAPVAMLPYLTGLREACSQRVRLSQRISAWESLLARLGKGVRRG